MKVLKGIKVRNMVSNKSYREVPNQFIIDTPKERVFQSYNVTIAVKRDGKTYLDRSYWNYSATTSKYRNEFLGESTSETRRKIEKGEYKLVNLN